jgi:CRISPR-associated endonuclease/helicase Cas3
MDDDPQTQTPFWLTIAEHTDDVLRELEVSLSELAAQLEPSWIEQLRLAARWHDAGKGHPVFQATMLRLQPPSKDQLWAKSDNKKKATHERRHFRHELASALAMLAAEKPFLSAYLAASHHGRARLAIRSLPAEKTPPAKDRLFALGIWDGEELPPIDLGSSESTPKLKLNLSVMRLGQDSWLQQALQLRDDPKVGPFRLAYLEALLRAADIRASKNPQRRG